MYRIVFHKLVVKNDLPKLDKSDQNKILNSIYKKLTIAPEKFGKPLHGQLKTFFKLRVNDYRVVYEIKKKEVTVLVFKIGQRKDSIVYEEAIKRLRWID
jgi:mRNA interferase RelE/StbE